MNFKKLRPRVTSLKQSKVIEELQNLATAEPPLVEQLRRTSVFLQKPQRPVPQPRKKQEEEEEVEVESYRVVIKKQQKRSITDRLLQSGLLKPEDDKTPEPPTPEVISMDSNEIGTKVEEDDTLSSPSSSIIPSETLDDGSCLQRQQEPELIVTCSEVPEVPEVSSPCVETGSGLSPLEPENPTNSTPEVASEVASKVASEVSSEVAQAELSNRKGNVVGAKQSPSKRKVKRFYTRAHYFRRCLFGKKGEAKKPGKVRPSLKDRVYQQDDARDQPRQGRRESRIKGHYLETYLKREDNWMRRVVDGLLEKPDSFSSSKSFHRLLSSKESLWRTRYGERILTRSVQFVAVRLYPDISKYLEGKRSKNFLDSIESNPPIRKRLYFKGRYFQRIFWRNFARLINYIRGVSEYRASKDYRGRDRRRSSMIKMKGHYMEKCLLQTSFLDRHDLRDRSSKHPSVVSSKRRLFVRTRYAERVLKKHFESLGLIVEYIRCQVLQSMSNSSAVSPTCSSLNWRQNEAFAEDEGGLSNLIRSSKDFISTEVFHRGSRRFSRSCRGSVSQGSPSSLASILGSFGLDFSWLPSRLVGGSTEQAISEKKALQDGDRDGRRLSFVPTILYEGFTNRIGVDFTRLVAYAFVPCTSIVLLYMYK